MKEIRFVDVGEGITEGHLQKWLVKDGDTVKEDQAVAQIETDKAIVNIPAPISGRIKLIAKENTDVKVGDTLATVGDGAPDTEPKKAAPATEKSVQQAAPVAQATAHIAAEPDAVATGKTKEILATPYVRKLARDLGIDLSKVTGTGPQGRVLENDVKAFANNGAVPKKLVPKFSEVLEEQHGEDIERVPMSQLRKTIAKNMELSWTIPRAVHMDIADAGHLFEIVKREKENTEKAGFKLTFLPFMIKAVVEALKESPRFNSSYDHDRQEIIVKKYYNVGLAAEAPDGLKVVVIKNADRKSISEIAKEIMALRKKVLDNTISLEEMHDGTFTITNIGSLGGGYLSVPMINYPEVAILGVHMIKEVPVVKDGKIVVGRQLPFSLVFDHRVVDGAEAVKFGNAFKRYIEDPEFLEML